MKPALWSVLGCCVAVGCVLQANPAVTPKKIHNVSPPIHAHALLLIAPSFEQYISQGPSGFHKVQTHYGASAVKAVSALVTGSFATAEIRRLTDVEVQTLLDGAADTSVGDLLLVPVFETANANGNVTTESPSFDDAGRVVVGASTYDETAEVRLRLNARSLRTGTSFTWVTLGRADSQPGWGRAAGLALETALHAMSDSLAAHRAELELVRPAP